MADAVVVGAGPAGSTVALALARRGFAVTIVERAPFPRRKVCGEYLNAGAVRALDDLGVLGAIRPHAYALRGIKMISGSISAEIAFPAPALSMERSRLDGLLLEAARAEGVAVVRGRVEGLLEDQRRIAGVRWRDEAGALRDLRAGFVVGADGAGSIVARKAGLTRASGTGRFAVGGHYAGLGNLDRWIELYVGDGAYFAVNPLDADRANVMVVVPRSALAAWSADVDDGLRGKAAHLSEGHRSLGATARLGERVSIGPLSHATRSAAAPGLLLCGDAAGFLNPFTGQGVLLALTSAERAAEAIVAAAASRAKERAAWSAYAAETARELRIRRRVSGAIDLLVNVPPLARHAAARLRAVPQAGVTMLEAVSGLRPPSAALRPSTLGRLFV